MGLFAPYTRRDTGSGRMGRLSRTAQQGLPARFEAVAEALVEGIDATAACAVVGRDLARDGADLGEALLNLRSTYLQVVGREPDFVALHALGVSWGEETLGFVHEISCEDPLTGLASLAHLRARIAEIYRGTGPDDPPRAHQLLVIDLPLTGERRAGDPFERALRMVRISELVRLVLPETETMCEAVEGRLLVLTVRSLALGRKVATLRELLVDVDGASGASRVWIESLPADPGAAGGVLDELART